MSGTVTLPLSGTEVKLITEFREGVPMGPITAYHLSCVLFERKVRTDTGNHRVLTFVQQSEPTS